MRDSRGEGGRGLAAARSKKAPPRGEGAWLVHDRGRRRVSTGIRNTTQGDTMPHFPREERKGQGGGGGGEGHRRGAAGGYLTLSVDESRGKRKRDTILFPLPELRQYEGRKRMSLPPADLRSESRRTPQVLRRPLDSRRRRGRGVCVGKG